MTANSVLMFLQGLHPGARAPTCRPLATPLSARDDFVINLMQQSCLLHDFTWYFGSPLQRGEL